MLQELEDLLVEHARLAPGAREAVRTGGEARLDEKCRGLTGVGVEEGRHLGGCGPRTGLPLTETGQDAAATEVGKLDSKGGQASKVDRSSK